METLLLRGHGVPTEDALTASLHDVLLDLGDRALVGALLASARTVAEGGTVTSVPLTLPETWDAFSLDVWPRWEEGIPDMVIRLLRGTKVVAHFTVEVKFGAPKSGADVEGDDALRDQLAWYLRGTAHHAPPDAAWGVIYLTTHAVPPGEELAASWTATRAKTDVDPVGRLAWLSWFEVDRRLRGAAHDYLSDSVAGRRLGRMRELLRYVGLQSFDGWRRVATASPPPINALNRWAFQSTPRPGAQDMVLSRWSGWQRFVGASPQALSRVVAPPRLWSGWTVGSLPPLSPTHT